MKFALFALLAIATIAFAQNPIPLPSLNLNKIAGLWYVVGAYPGNSYPGVTCYTMNVNVISDSLIQTTVTLVWMGKKIVSMSFLQVQHDGSVWVDQEGTESIWISLDPASASWATVVAGNQQAAMIISRNPTLSSAILQSQYTLLQTEGYNANSGNTYIVPNNNC